MSKRKTPPGFDGQDGKQDGRHSVRQAGVTTDSSVQVTRSGEDQTHQSTTGKAKKKMIAAQQQLAVGPPPPPVSAARVHAALMSSHVYRYSHAHYSHALTVWPAPRRSRSRRWRRSNGFPQPAATGYCRHSLFSTTTADEDNNLFAL